MKNPLRQLILPLSLLFVIVSIGIAGYVYIEGWTFLEASYMLVITLFTVGFREVHPLSTFGHLLTMAIIIFGVGTALYTFSQIGEMVVEGHLLGYRRKKRMKKQIREMKDHYIICGYGRVGHQVAQEFEAARIDYVVIDNKPEVAEELELKGVPYIIGDLTTNDKLEEAGIKQAKGLVACADSDMGNVFVTLSARAANPNLFIIARGSTKDSEEKLRLAGANRVISPYFISGRRIAAMALRPVASDFLDMVMHGDHLEFSLRDINVGEHSSLANKTLAEGAIREKTGATVLAIRKNKSQFNIQPGGDSKIEPGDILIVIGTNEQLDKLEKIIGKRW
jgi:voltage-gated potassium channel